MKKQIPTYLNQMKDVIDQALLKYLPAENQYPENLIKSMHYSVFAGGKRLRPILVLSAAEAVNGPVDQIMPFALGTELIHTYTLIHDDLPALDDDDLRRGKPTNHKAFGESTAILAGDALLTYAFQLMTDIKLMPTIPAEAILKAAHEFAEAIGPFGTIGGQIVDLESEGREIDRSTLEYIHNHKTGCLISSSLKSGGILSGCSENELKALASFGENIGLAFQIIDDILDVTGNQAELGKDAKSDIKSGKATYPALFGLDESKNMAKKLVDAGIEHLACFDKKAEHLREIANYFISRTY